MIYFDTSYLVRLYLPDPGFELVRELAATDHLGCSIHGQSEMIAAFHRKLREKAITPSAYRALLAQYAADEESGAFQWLPTGPDVAARIRDVYSTLPGTVYLRAADATHLAAASVHGFDRIYSNDRHLLAAAPIFGLAGKNFLPSP